MPRLKQIAVLGSTGMLGQALVSAAREENIEVVGVARKGADVNLDVSDTRALTEFVSSTDFDAVINCCAIVNLKHCDDFPSEAFAVNAQPSKTLADLATVRGCKYVYISTDGFFDDSPEKKHAENDEIVLLNEYARTKFQGEEFALADPRSLVVRTNIVGFRHDASRPTFVEWALDALKKELPMTLFDDYFTSSIDVASFSRALLKLMAKDVSGRINLASRDVFNKDAFIRTLARRFGYPLTHATTAHMLSNAAPRRPKTLGLDVALAESLLGYALPSLEEVISNLKAEYDHDVQPRD